MTCPIEGGLGLTLHMPLNNSRIYQVYSRAEVHQVDEGLQTYLKELRDRLPSQGVWFFTNDRKQLLKKVYKGILQNFAKNNATVLEVNKVKPGFLTSSEHKNFIEPNHIIMILTKNHNHRQKAILKQVEIMKIPYTLVILGDSYRTKYDSLWLEDVRAIYVLLYNLDTLNNEGVPLDKAEFLNKYRFV